VYLVIIESPYRGKTDADRQNNMLYARDCIKDSLVRGESPLASHLLYTQPGILDDNKGEEREKGIKAGLAWYKSADYIVLYTDKGISKGMQNALEFASKYNIKFIFRKLGET